MVKIWGKISSEPRWYTDGSLCNSSPGAGIYCSHLKCQMSKVKGQMRQNRPSLFTSTCVDRQ